MERENKISRLIKRLLVSPFVLGILIITYTIGLIKHWIRFIKYGGEWVGYDRDDHTSMQIMLNEFRAKGWINIKERLPKLDEIVLVAHRKMNKNDWNYSAGWICKESKKWVNEQGDEIESDIDYYSVWFWKPIINPSK